MDGSIPSPWHRVRLLNVNQRKETEALHLSQPLLQATLDALSAHIAILDQSGTIIAINAAWDRFGVVNPLIGIACGVGTRYLETCESMVGDIKPAAQAIATGIRKIMTCQQDEFHMEYSCNSLGKQSWFLVQVTRFEEASSIRIVIAHEDITERRQTEAALRYVVEGTSAVTGRDFFHSLVYHLACALEVKYAFVTECLEDETPSTVRTLAFWTGNSFGENFDYALAFTPCQRVIGGKICYYATDVQAFFPKDQDLSKLNAQSYLGVPVFNSSGKAVGHLVVLNDEPMGNEPRGLSILKIFAARAGAELERQRAANQLLHDALHDALTDLPNRTLFSDRLKCACEKVKRYPEHKFAVLFLDLDRFKVINDSLGHARGDQLLIVMARRIESCLRTGDTVARLGGDEFAILLEVIKDIGDAIKVVKRIQQELASPFYLGQHEVFISVSIGIALSESGFVRAEDHLRNADLAMYRAKVQGRACYEIFDTTMHSQAMTRLQQETDLRRAIDRGELRLHYQPIVSLTTGQVTGFEALVRWQHPQRGLVYPNEFIRLAEETGLIIPLGWWVLQEACYQLNEWQTTFANSALTMSVNFSNKQISQPGLSEHITQIIQATGLEPESLHLEITESALMDNAEAASAMLWQLRALGVRLHLDDFGTGYSSLSYLHQLPINVLKIDRSFVSRIGASGENGEIVETIVMLARNLNMEIIAEGVETEVQLAKLRVLGCQYGQGYLFSQPLDSEALQAWLPTRTESISLAIPA